MSNEASYTFGNCTYYVAKVLDWVPAGLGDAKDWLANAQAKGLPTTNIPTPGSVVVYGAGQGMSPFGHVAIVQSLNGDGTFNVSEMNFAGFNQVDTRRSTMSDVQGFILPPGGSADAGSQFMASSGGFTLPGTNIQIGSGSVPFFTGLGTITGWLTDNRNWWKLGFMAAGTLMIWWGFELYFLRDVESSPEVREAAEVAAHG